MNNSKSFLRWAGSKKRLIPKLSTYWNAGFSRYVEPFMGSATLFFAIQPSKAILSDTNPNLIETFCAVREHPYAVYKLLISLPLGKDAYYRIRQEDVSMMSPLKRAAYFIYLNRFCFNGLYRTNLDGKFNVPYASSKTGQLPTKEELYEASKILDRAHIFAGDFEHTLQGVKKGDFVYMDPPYAVQNRRIFRQYGPNCFGTDDLTRLARTLPTIDYCGATFLVSYALCKEALEAFRGWNIRRIQTQRSIAGFSHDRRKAIEILVSNHKLPNWN